MSPDTSLPVVVITGVGGIGVGAARRIGSGRLIVLADLNNASLEFTVSQLEKEGYDVKPFELDVGRAESVTKLASYAASLGRIETVVHTAGVAPDNASAKSIYDVNLVGTAHVIDSFKSVLSAGSSLICLSSTAAYLGQHIPAAEEPHFCSASTSMLLDSPTINFESDTARKAYCVSKKANNLRVQASTVAYGAIGARINLVTPGVVATAMGQALLDGPDGKQVKAAIAAAPIKRIATPGEVAEAIAFLAGPTASYITGAEIVMDGGDGIHDAVEACLTTATQRSASSLFFLITDVDGTLEVAANNIIYDKAVY